MTTEHTYRVPAFTMLELIDMRVALKDSVCRYFKWRHDPVWREFLRTHISAYRKLQQEEIV
jgi:tRNA(His) 5'-end guanylyltransferase